MEFNNNITTIIHRGMTYLARTQKRHSIFRFFSYFSALFLLLLLLPVFHRIRGRGQVARMAPRRRGRDTRHEFLLGDRFIGGVL